MGDVWKWGDEVGGNLWRTTGDIVDTWLSVYDIGFSQYKLAEYAQPGHWNDPDMLVLGWVGWGPNLHPTRLTISEQYSHMSLWALLSAPLLLGNDLSRLDDFTLGLLKNDEVIAVNQDALGAQAERVLIDDDIQIWKKKLHDGSLAIGIFNLGNEDTEYTLDFKDIGLRNVVKIRDLWRKKDMGEFEDDFETVLFKHGVKLLRIEQ
jgi:hypothetical protein